MAEKQTDHQGLSYRLCSEIAEPLQKLKEKIVDKKLVNDLEIEIRMLVSNVYKLKDETVRQNWIKGIRNKLEVFLAEKGENIGDRVLSEVQRYKEMVRKTLNGVDDTEYCLYG